MTVNVPGLALVLTVVWIVAVAGVRGVIGYRRTGQVAIRTATAPARRGSVAAR